MSLVKGKFVDKTIPIQSDNDPVDVKDLARKGYVDSKAASEASAKVEDQIVDGVTGKAPSQNAVFDALALKLSTSLKGAVNGLAELDAAGKVPVSQIPASVGAVQSVNTKTGAVVLQTDDIAEAASPTNKWFTDARAKAAAVGDAIADGVTDKAPSQNAVYDALALKLDQSSKGAAGGVAGLDGSGKVPSAQLPSYVDDVIEAANLAALPVTGENGKIYVTLDTNKCYRWTGSTYIEISPSPGSTDALAEGSVNKYYTDTRAKTAAVVNSTSGSQTDQASSVSSMKFYVGTQIATKVSKSGDTMTGKLTISAGATTALETTGKISIKDVTAGEIFNFNPSLGSFSSSYAATPHIVSMMKPDYISVYQLTPNMIDTVGETTILPGAIELLGPLGVPAVPTLDEHVVNKKYVDSGLLLKAAASHTHTASQITDFALAAKSAAVADAIADGITNIAPSQNAVFDALALKLSTSLKGAVNGLAELDGSGKVPTAQLPALAITETSVVASQAAMLALTAQKGDVAIRTDLNKSFILAGTDPTALADWKELLTPTDAVLSVNGKTGSVSLNSDDISEGSTNKYFSASAAKSAAVVNSTAGSETDQAASVSSMKSYLSGQISAIPAPAIPQGKKDRVVLSAGDISNGYIDCAFEAMASTMMVMTGGVIHNEGSGDDYVLSVVAGKTRISFEPNLAAILASGDNIYLKYLRLV